MQLLKSGNDNNNSESSIEKLCSSASLSVEVHQSSYSTMSIDSIKTKVEAYLNVIDCSFVPVKFGHTHFDEIDLNDLRDFLKLHVKQIRIYLLNAENDCDTGQYVSFKTCDLNLSVFTLACDQEAEVANEMIMIGDDHITCGETWQLPSKLLDDSWDNLIFDTDIKQKLLDYSQTALLFAEKSVSSAIITWNRMVLLYGPPGTGKTSLCKAIAQKLSIRQYERYTSMNLVEVRSENLLSKYFSESAKFVSAMFESLESQLENPDHLMFLLIDEVESLATIRRNAGSSCEPSDAMRVVNSVLTHIDKLKKFPNVLILATSNITNVLDPAFLDRADIRMYVGHPSTAAIYSLYRSCLNELSRVGIIKCDNQIPTFSELQVLKTNSSKLASEVQQLFDVAEKSLGLNGRTIRKLPLLAHAFCVPKITSLLTSIHLEDFISALKKAIEHQFDELNTLLSDDGSAKVPERIVLKENIKNNVPIL